MPAIEQDIPTNRKRIENFYVLYPFFLTSTAFVDTNAILVMSYEACFQLAVMSLLRKRYDMVAYLLQTVP